MLKDSKNSNAVTVGSANTVRSVDKTLQASVFDSIVKNLGRAEREKILEAYDLKRFVRVFEDVELMRTAECLFENNLNVSRSAVYLYMHRNTLIYRLKKLKRITGLDICDFYDAVIFKILYVLYTEK